jgi:hypothetical protein
VYIFLSSVSLTLRIIWLHTLSHKKRIRGKWEGTHYVQEMSTIKLEDSILIYDTIGKTCATQQQQLYHWAVNISLQLNLRDCDRPMIKLLLLGGARFTNCVILSLIYCWQYTVEQYRRVIRQRTKWFVILV